MKHLLLAIFIFLLTTCSPPVEDTNDKLGSINNEIVLDLNQLTYQIANEHDQFYSFIGVRALAMVHLAMHDILNAVNPKFEPYLFNFTVAEVDPIVAISESTRVILTAAYPSRTDTIDLICNKWKNSITDSKFKEAGLSLGNSIALAYLQLRHNDGHEKQGDYTPMTKPGDYQYTPGFDWVWKPDFSVARPFTLDSIAQFRSPAPPEISSEEYLSSFNEVKEFGSKTSRVRTADQTHFAHWWAEFGEHSWNRIGRITAKEKELPITETARMFALINMNLYDLYLVSFDSKYHYDTWRPYTAIQNADSDTNPNTIEEKTWQPEMVTPPWPEYPSAHAAVGASGAEIVGHVYGTVTISFSMQSTSALPNAPERHYGNLDQAANDCADSRIMNGFHFRFATEEGKKQGRSLAKHTVENFLRPI